MLPMLLSDMGIPSKPAGRAGQARVRLRAGPVSSVDSAADHARMSSLAAFTSRSMFTPNPRPFGAAIVRTRSGRMLLRALNAVMQQCDPSAHAEVRAIRLATKRLRKLSLAGYTLYTTCEPCPMCMSAALWARLDRVVYGVTIADANRHCNQIRIPASEIASRSDMQCIVDGPILRDECYALFTHPRMVRAFRLWSTRKGNGSGNDR